MRFRFQLISQNSYMLGARALTLGVTFLITAMSSRILGTVADFGQLMLIAAYYVFLREVSVFSFKTYLVREIIAKQKSPLPALTHIFFFSSFLVLAGTGLTTATLKILAYPDQIIALSALFNLSLIFEIVIHNNESYFESSKRFDYLFYTHLSYGIIRILIFLLFTFKSPTMQKIVFSFIASSLTASLFHVYVLNRMVTLKDFGLSPLSIKKTISVSCVFFLSSIFYGLLNSLDVMILSKVSGDGAVGIYSPAMRLNKFCFIYAFSLMSVIYPHFVSFLKVQPDDYPLFAKKVFAFIVFSAIPIQFLFPYFAKYVILFFFGSRYMDSIPILKIIVFCQVPFAIYFFCSRFFLSLHREKLTVAIDFASLVANFMLLILLTGPFQAKGAAAAIVLTNVFLLTVYLFFLSRQKVTFSYLGILLKNAAFLIVTGGYFLLTYGKAFQPIADIINVLVVLVITAAAFFLMDDLNFLKKIKA